MTEIGAAGEEAAAVGGAHVLDTDQAGPTAIRGGSVRVVGYAGGLLLSLISAPLLIRHLGLIGFGQYATALSIVAVAAGITEFGLRDAATREYATSSGGARDELMATTLGVRVTVSILGILLARAFTEVAGYSQTLVAGVLIASAGQLFNSLQLVIAIPLAVDLRLITMTMLDLAQQVITVLLTVAFVVAGLGILWFLGIQLLAPIPPLIATAWLVRGQIPFRVSLGITLARRILTATLPFTAVTLVAVAYFRLSIIVISLISTKLQTGYFATSYRVIEALIYVPSVLVAAAFPILSRAARDDAVRFSYAVRRLFDVALIGGAAFGLLLVVGAPVVIHVLVGHGGKPIIPILRIHALVMPSSFLIAVGGYALLAHHRHRAVVSCVSAGLLVNAALLGLLVPSDGAIGGAIAGASGEATIATMMIAFLLRIEGVQVSVRTAVSVVAATCAALAIALASGLPALPASVVAAVVFGGIVFASGVFPPEILAAMRSR